MIIVCPQCESRYELGEDNVPQAGRPVRCTRCRASWLAFPEPVGGGNLDDMVPAPISRELADEDAGFGPAPLEDGETLTTAALLQEAAASLSIDHVPHPEAARAVNVEAIEAQAATSSWRRRPKRPRPDRPGRRRRSALLPRARTMGLAAAVAAVAALVTFRTEMVEAYPSAASLYALARLPVNLRGLAFEAVRTSQAKEGQAGVLVVEGMIRNVEAQDRPVPRVRLAIRDDKDVEVYSWTVAPARTVLAPGQTLAFKTRLASPPAEGRGVVVRFLRGEDMLAAPK